MQRMVKLLLLRINSLRSRSQTHSSQVHLQSTCKTPPSHSLVVMVERVSSQLQREEKEKPPSNKWREIHLTQTLKWTSTPLSWTATQLSQPLTLAMWFLSLWTELTSDSMSTSSLPSHRKSKPNSSSEFQQEDRSPKTSQSWTTLARSGKLSLTSRRRRASSNSTSAELKCLWRRVLPRTSS